MMHMGAANVRAAGSSLQTRSCGNDRSVQVEEPHQGGRIPQHRPTERTDHTDREEPNAETPRAGERPGRLNPRKAASTKKALRGRRRPSPRWTPKTGH